MFMTLLIVLIARLTQVIVLFIHKFLDRKKVKIFNSQRDGCFLMSFLSAPIFFWS